MSEREIGYIRQRLGEMEQRERERDKEISDIKRTVDVGFTEVKGTLESLSKQLDQRLNQVESSNKRILKWVSGIASTIITGLILWKILG